MYIEMNAKEMSNIMNMQPQLDMDLENKYLLLTPGPLSTSATVRRAMQKIGVRGTKNTTRWYKIFVIDW